MTRAYDNSAHDEAAQVRNDRERDADDDLEVQSVDALLAIQRARREALDRALEWLTSSGADTTVWQHQVDELRCDLLNAEAALARAAIARAETP